MKWNLIREICEVLTMIGALRFGTFELSGGKLSPYYIDLRIAPSFPEAFGRIEAIYLEIVSRSFLMSSSASGPVYLKIMSPD